MPRIKVEETYIIQGINDRKEVEYYGKKEPGQEKDEYLGGSWWENQDETLLITYSIYGDLKLTVYREENGYGVVKDRRDQNIIFETPIYHTSR